MSHAGLALLRAVSDKTGLTSGLSRALATPRLLVHDRGRVLADLAAAIGDGAEVSEIAVVTRGARARTCPASAAFVSHVLDPCGVAPDAPQHPADRPGQHHGPQLVAAAFGMDAESVMIYLADRIDPGRMPARRLSTGRLSGHPS